MELKLLTKYWREKYTQKQIISRYFARTRWKNFVVLKSSAARRPSSYDLSVLSFINTFNIFGPSSTTGAAASCAFRSVTYLAVIPTAVAEAAVAASLVFLATCS